MSSKYPRHLREQYQLNQLIKLRHAAEYAFRVSSALSRLAASYHSVIATFHSSQSAKT